ncbi:ABC transporter permease [Spirochaeta thermophila]|nr:ABC transporter permease [Spirochaeta thermophila]
MDMTLLHSLLQRTLVAGTPLLLGILGEVLTERAGILNLGIEGLMSVGAVVAFMVGFSTGSALLAVLAAMAAAALLAGVHAFFSVSLRGNQVVSGLALAMVGTGIASVWGKSYIGMRQPVRVAPLDVPFLSEIPVVGVLFSQSAFFYLGLVLAVLLWFFFYHTRGGVILRSVGEHPRAAESEGVPVQRVRILATVTGGAFSGLAGAQLVLSYTASWTEGVVGGRGWIVVALTIFSLWHPLRAVWGAFLFGGIFVLQYVLQPWGFSPNLLAMLPYLATLLILTTEGLRRERRRGREPAMLGEPYAPGER